MLWHMARPPFAELLRRQRLARGLTQQELAERARLSERSISDLERGVKNAPRLTTLRLLIDALGLEGEEAVALREAVESVHADALLTGPEPLFDIQYARRADGGATAYGTIGCGPVLLVPPGTISHLEWYGSAPGVSAFLQPLAEHRTVVFYDRHGCGLSDRDRIDFTAEDDMQDLEAVADAVGRDDVELLGTSFGAGPAIVYAARHPEQVRRLVLYGPGTGASRVSAAGAHALDSPDFKGLTDAIADRRAAMTTLRRADLELFVRAVAMQFFPSGVDEAMFRSFVHIFRIAATPEMQEQLETVRFEFESLLSTITVPTLVLHRRGDQMAPFVRGQELARRIPRARFVPLEGDAHFYFVDDWQSIVRPMLDFLLGRSSKTLG
jgi:pimeloyl-ACP methyl ester carboxylesterase/DNA-binding XRE family transcriptional regulator